MKNPDEMKILRQMLVKADVFIQNLMPGALERLGVSMKNLRKENPTIITCDISGYGATGPFAQMKAYDFLKNPREVCFFHRKHLPRTIVFFGQDSAP